MKKLSFNTLRGLFVDIVNNTAKVGLYCFGKYKICIFKTSKDEDIEVLERIIKFSKRDNPHEFKIARDNYNKRHRKMYAKRIKNGECVKCRSKDLQILKNGNKGALCKKCRKQKNISDIAIYNRKYNR